MEASRRSSADSATKTFLVKGRAGLGDRILAALAGILYARASGRRLVIDWSDWVYSGDGTNVFPRLFACPLATEGPLPATASVRPTIWEGHLHESSQSLQELSGERDWRKFKRLSSCSLTRVDYTEDVLVFWSYSPEINAFRRHLRGGLAPLRLAPTKAILRGLLACDLTPTSAVQDRVDRFRGEHLRPGTVGVHVRYTDLRVSLDRILAEVDRLVSRRVTPPIFLATDNAEITSLFASRYRDVVSTPHWFPAGDAARLHGHPECPDLLENAIEALTDLYLLAACDRLIVDSSSTFARVAGLLADGPVTDVRPVVPRVLQALSRHSRSAARVLTIRVARNRAAP